MTSAQRHAVVALLSKLCARSLAAGSDAAAAKAAIAVHRLGAHPQGACVVCGRTAMVEWYLCRGCADIMLAHNRSDNLSWVDLAAWLLRTNAVEFQARPAYRGGDGVVEVACHLHGLRPVHWRLRDQWRELGWPG